MSSWITEKHQLIRQRTQRQLVAQLKPNKTPSWQKPSDRAHNLFQTSAKPSQPSSELSWAFWTRNINHNSSSLLCISRKLSSSKLCVTIKGRCNCNWSPKLSSFKTKTRYCSKTSRMVHSYPTCSAEHKTTPDVKSPTWRPSWVIVTSSLPSFNDSSRRSRTKNLSTKRAWLRR